MNNVLIILGVVLIIVGIFAYAYTTVAADGILGEQTKTPYRNLSYYLIAGGIILTIIGLLVPSSKDEYHPLP